MSLALILYVLKHLITQDPDNTSDIHAPCIDFVCFKAPDNIKPW